MSASKETSGPAAGPATTLLVAAALTFLVAPGACRDGGDGDVDVDADTDVDADSDPSFQRPTPPALCTNSDCVAYCRLVGGETGSCVGEDCVCSGCDLERCNGYCFWWEDQKEADTEACDDGGCTCTPCSGMCVGIMWDALLFDAPRLPAVFYGDYYCEDGHCVPTLWCESGRCVDECEDDLCDESCVVAWGGHGACAGGICACTCDAALCSAACAEDFAGTGQCLGGMCHCKCDPALCSREGWSCGGNDACPIAMFSLQPEETVSCQCRSDEW